MSPICDFDGCERGGEHQTFTDKPDVPRGITAGWWCRKHFQWAFYQAIDNARASIATQIDELAEGLSIPSLTEWKQGKFIDGPQYAKQPESWKSEQKDREESLIRPGGGTNNALFQVSGYSSPEVITEYLEAVAKLLRDAA